MQDREAKLVGLLIKRLQPFVDGQKQSFETSIKEEAENLADSTFGGPMLKTIGYASPLPCTPGGEQRIRKDLVILFKDQPRVLSLLLH